MIIEANAGDQIGAGHGFDIIFQIDTGEGGAVLVLRCVGSPEVPGIVSPLLLVACIDAGSSS